MDIMGSLWSNRLLGKLFGSGVDAEHVASTKALMEKSFGEIKIDEREKGGKAHAFFAKQTLVGDANLKNRFCYNHPIISLRMEEPVGSGRNKEAAILDLYEQMTSLRAHENILQLEQTIDYGISPHAIYKRFGLKDGKFIEHGKMQNDRPPERPAQIQTFLAFERYLESIRSNKDIVGQAVPAFYKA